jgi:D-amino peptidase
MKVFISFDMEGVAGIVDWSQCIPPGRPYAEGRRLLLGEVNAAIDGALAAGATEIVCNDSHGAMNNLDPELLHGQATYVSGRHKPLYMMQGLEAGADVVFMVGYHGSISGESSVLSHTYNPSVISHVTLNGVRVGESGINALVALGCEVPIGLISGDRQTAGEADPFLADAERVVVKESFTRFGAVNQHPEVARAKIAEAARRAVERAGQSAGSPRRPAIPLPATLEVHMQTADMAEVASWVRGAERRADGDHRRRRPDGDVPVVRRGDLHHAPVRGTVGRFTRSASRPRRQSPGPGPSARSRRPGRAGGSSRRRPVRPPSPARAPAT